VGHLDQTFPSVIDVLQVASSLKQRTARVNDHAEILLARADGLAALTSVNSEKGD
jgi:hypothetical protein